MATRRKTTKTTRRRKDPADDTLKVGEAKFCEALGELAAAVGEVDFEERALAFIARLAPHDYTIMTRYSRFSPPDFLVHGRDFSERMARRYLTEFYRFDPFFAYWREHEKPGVVWLGDLSSQAVKRGRYVREFMVESGIGDELGMFLPPMGHASVALFLERKTGRFGERDRERLRRVYPIIAGLRRAHVSTLFGRAHRGEDAVAALQASRPVMVSDAGGERVYANADWQELEATDAAPVAVAMAGMRESGAEQYILPGDRIMLRQQLDEDFRSAPKGHLWTVEAVVPSAPGDAQDDGATPFEEQLTPRECEIVALILDGYPTSLIAKKLGLSRGTVKNHRRRIYYKLDITSERELFRQYIDHLKESPGAAA